MDNRFRLAELLGAFSFAGDLGRGQPVGHVLRTCRIAMAVATRLNLPVSALADVYYTALLVHAGCTAGASEFAAFLASDELSAQKDFCLCDPDNLVQLLGWLQRNVAPGRPLPARTARMFQLLIQGERAMQDVDQGCSEVGSRIAARLGMSEATQKSLYHICETWNGKGPHHLRGDDVPLPARIVNVAMITEVFAAERGIEAARGAALARRRKSFDPDVVDALVAVLDQGTFSVDLKAQEPWDSVLGLEPVPQRGVDEGGLDALALAFADFADLKAPATSTHSRRTAEVAEGIARRLHLDDTEVSLIRRAALVHDLGSVAVPSLVLEKQGPRTEAETERFRLHPYFTERILTRAEPLRTIGSVAAMHHERLDGSGYFKGLSGSQLPLTARAVALADAYVELTEPAAGAQGQDPGAAIKALSGDDPKLFDGDCLAALAAEVQGRTAPASRPVWPAGLTDREVEVLRLVARGSSVRDAAARLVISNHTARHHLESIYSKAGVISRAGAVLFAVENNLLR